MKFTLVVSVTAAALLSSCTVISDLAGLSNSCVENKDDGTRMCTMIDTNQNITTRTIERDHKLFVSTCSNGNCTEYKEINAAK
jgi:hypothetical protein